MIKEFFHMPGLERFTGRMFRFLSPNRWTTLSLILALCGFGLVVSSHTGWGAALFILSGCADGIDGKVARYTGQATAVGAFWDGVVDRFVDGLILLSFWFLDFPDVPLDIELLLFLLLFATLLPPFIVAYANHRQAVPDPTETVIWRLGFRIEYLVLFLAALIVFPATPLTSYYVLLAALILMSATVVQSIVLVFIKARHYH